MSRIAPSLFLLSLLVIACGSETGAPDGGDSLTNGPRYALATRVVAPDFSSSTGYLVTVPSLDATTKVDLSKAAELGVGEWLFGPPQTGAVFTAALDNPVITRWTVNADGTFSKGTQLSFANLGVSGVYGAAYSTFYSDEKAYFVDADGHQLILWNPKAMTILGRIPLELAAQGELQPQLETSLLVRQDRIIATAYWALLDGAWVQYGDQAKIFVIDPHTDTVVSTSDEARSAEVSLAGVTSDGTAYFSPWDYRAAVRSLFGAGYGTDSTLLRIVPPGELPEAGYAVDLNALTGGRPAGSMALVSDDVAFLHVFDPALNGATSENWDETRFKANYTWWRWHIGDATATEIPGQTPSAEGPSVATIDGRTYASMYADDFSSTSLMELRPEGQLVPGLSGSGMFLGIVRVR